MPRVAEMLTEAMRRKNVTQQWLARETGITAPWINMILRRGKAPGPEALLRMAGALGIDKGTLIRQAHYERAHDEWKPYLEHEGDDDGPSPLTGMVPVVGRMTRGSSGAETVQECDEVEHPPRPNGTDEAADAPGAYSRTAEDGRPTWFVGFDPECMAIRVEGDALEPVAYDGQYVVVSPKARREDVPDGAIVYVTYEPPGETKPRAMIRRMYRYRLAGDGDEKGGERSSTRAGRPLVRLSPGQRRPLTRPGLPIYNFVPVNTRLRMKGREPEPEGAITLRHRQVREMFPVVGVVFASG